MIGSILLMSALLALGMLIVIAAVYGKKGTEDPSPSVLLLACLLFVASILTGIGIGYQRGQIDALNGKVCYELRTNPDKTVEWVRKDR